MNNPYEAESTFLNIPRKWSWILVSDWWNWFQHSSVLAVKLDAEGQTEQGRLSESTRDRTVWFLFCFVLTDSIFCDFKKQKHVLKTSGWFYSYSFQNFRRSVCHRPAGQQLHVLRFFSVCSWCQTVSAQINSLFISPSFVCCYHHQCLVPVWFLMKRPGFFLFFFFPPSTIFPALLCTVWNREV